MVALVRLLLLPPEPSTTQQRTILRASAQERFEPLQFLYPFDETCCFKWKRAHGWLFHHGAFLDATCFHFLGGAVAAQRLVVAMELERTYLLVRTRDKITARLPVFI
jgi:hypothetical protein